MKVVEPIKAGEETITYNVDHVIPTAYIEKPHFPVRIKDHAKASAVIRKSYTRTPTPLEQIKVEPSIAMVKDLLVDGHVIYFYDEAARIARPDNKDKHRHVVSMPVVSVKIGDHCYHGLCDLGATVSAIPFTLYQEIMNDTALVVTEDIDVIVKLANLILSHQLGLLEMLKFCVGRLNTLLIFLLLVPHKMIFVPLFLVDPS